MTRALKAAAKAIAEEHSLPPGWDARYAWVALHAALPAEPEIKFIESLAIPMSQDDWSFYSMGLAAYRSIRAQILGEDA